MFLKKFAIITMFLLTLSLPMTASVFAQTTVRDSGNNSGTVVQDSGNSEPVSIRLANPLKTIDNIPDFVRALLDIVLTIAIPVIALAIIYAGYKFIAAQGNPTKLEEAKDTLKYVLIGAAILLAAYVIAEVIVNTVNAIRS